MRTAVAAALAALATACVPSTVQHAPAASPPAPPVVDTSFLSNDCLACHSTDLVAQQRLTDKQWSKSLDKMRTWGAPTEDDEVAPLLTHLVATASHETPPSSPRIFSASEAAALFATEPDGKFAKGDVARGGPLYADRCAPCHADDARGGTMGVALAGRRVLDHAPELAHAIRSGRGRMPEYPDTTDQEIADMIAYLRSLHAR